MSTLNFLSLMNLSSSEETLEFNGDFLEVEVIASTTPEPGGLRDEEEEDNLSSLGFTIAAVCLFFIAVLGCMNNIIVILVVSSNKNLRTPMNAILLNLSVSDFTISAFGTPLSFVSALSHRWVFGDLLCRIYAFMMTLTGMTSIGTLAAIAIERYIIISRPFHSAGLTSQSAVIAITLIWIYSLSQAVPPLIGWNEYVVEHPGIACSLNWQISSWSHSSYIIFIFSVGYVIPVAIMAVCYSRVVWIIKKSPRMTGKSSAAKAETKVTWMAAAMIICTMTAWTPYAVVSLIVAMGYSQLVGPVSSVCPAIFAKTSVIYNPIIYFFLNSQIRDAILVKVPLLCRRKPMTSKDDISLDTKVGFTGMNNTVISGHTNCQRMEPQSVTDIA